MALVTIHDLSIRFHGPPLLDRVNCQIERGQRVGLLGRNGAGKSTLLHLLCGMVEPDGGELVLAPGTKVSLLPQNVPLGITGRVEEVVAHGLPPVHDGQEGQWRNEQQVERVLSRMELDGDASFEVLSSGMMRRVLLARALVTDPDLLLLDEPTNHLDIEAISWLEQFLDRWDATFIFVTHDREFLRKLSGRILELDRGRLFDWSCDYDTFRTRKEDWLAAEEKQNALFDKRLAEEEVWIRQGIKARRTRNEGRARSLHNMRRQRQQRRTAAGRVRLELHQELRSGNLVTHAENLSFGYDQRTIIPDFSTTIMRGDKVGVIGRNGVGKSTLLQLLLGQLSPTQGSIRHGTNLQIAYFDQLRGQLDEDKTVLDNVADGYDTIRVGDKTQHVIGYLQDFLFTPERARTQVRYLSGGERSRILLARLFAKPANVVVLDEPTNDLDTETLELLEELLVDFDGTVLLVSHDRAFLNNVVTSTIVFEDGHVREYVGGYDDWLRQRASVASRSDSSQGRQQEASQAKARSATASATSRQESRRLTYREQQELAALPDTIERLEAKIADLHQAMCQPDYFKRDGNEIAREATLLQKLEKQLADAYHRWEELEARSG